MPRHRNPDTGEIVEVPSYADRDEAQRHAGNVLDEPPTIFPPGGRPSDSPAREERKAGDLAPPGLPDDDPPSRLDVDFGASPPPGTEVPKGGPVVGWVVVVDGPGTGQARALGYGANPLGRGADARVRLDFGDDRISRQAHAIVTYDPRGRKFYLQPGGSTNLTYLGDAAVLIPTVLEGMQDFSIGATTLRFVPFCGPDFDWQDAGQDAGEA